MTGLLNLFTRRQERSGCSPLLLLGGAVIAFLAATTILWSNEGRVDFGRIGANSVAIETEVIDPAQDGVFVAARGVLVGDTPVGDETFLRPGRWLEVQRLVEMYAWEEKVKSDAGSGTRTPADYTYRTVWTDDPADSSSFAAARTHRNPPLPVRGGVFRPETGHIGAYAVDLRSLDLPDPSPIVLDRETVILRADRILTGEYIFIGQGAWQNPQVGDLRIHYRAVASDKQATLFGQVEGSQIGPYFHKGRDRLYRAFFRGRTDALAAMSAEYRFTLWGLRAAGLALYWGGLLLVLSPFTRLLGGVPLLGRLGKGLMALVTFVAAALLTLVVASVAYLFHNPLALLALIALAGMILAVGRVVWQRRQK